MHLSEWFHLIAGIQRIQWIGQFVGEEIKENEETVRVAIIAIARTNGGDKCALSVANESIMTHYVARSYTIMMVLWSQQTVPPTLELVPFTGDHKLNFWLRSFELESFELEVRDRQSIQSFSQLQLIFW